MKCNQRKLVREGFGNKLSKHFLTQGNPGAPIPTLGSGEIDDKMQVVPKEFPIPCAGILGVDYLNKHRAIVNSGKLSLRVYTKYIPLRKKLRVYKTFTGTQILKTYSDIAHAEADNCTESDADISVGATVGNESCVTEQLRALGDDGQSLAEAYSLNVAAAQTFEELNVREEKEEMLEARILNMYAVSTGVKDPGNTTNVPKAEASRVERIMSLVGTDGLNKEELAQVRTLIELNQDVMHLEDDALTATNIVQHQIRTTDDYPIRMKQYRVPHNLKEEVDRQVREMLDQGIIRPCKSPYNSALWIVPKKPDTDGTVRWRLVVDFRPLNDKTITDGQPIPNTQDIFDQV